VILVALSLVVIFVLWPAVARYRQRRFYGPLAKRIENLELKTAGGHLHQGQP